MADNGASEPRPDSPPAQQQTPPGVLGEMRPKPDHGEESYRGSGKLTGKAAVITGGDSGIGRAVAIAFAREGADVLISYLNEHEDAKDTAKYVEEAGRRCVLVAGDLADRAHAKTIIPKAVEEFGRVDVLVNNAAFQMSHDSLDEVSDDEWDYTLAVNLSAMFTLCKDAMPHMEPGASIINSSSVNSDQPNPTLAPYAMTKAGDRQLQRLAGADAGREGHPREQRRPGSDLDAADPGDDAAGEGRELRRAGAAGPRRPAGRAGPGLRAAGQRRGELRLRRPRRGDRRQAHL